MAFCGRCGATLADGVAYCSSCGAPVGAGGAPAAMDSNVAAFLSYIFGFITGVIFLVIDQYRNDNFVRFHAFQSIFFNVAVIAFWIAWTAMSMMLGVVSSVIITIMMWGFGFMIYFGVLAYWIFLMYKAYNNERYMIPFIGELAAKQAG